MTTERITMRVSGAIYTVHENADAAEPSDRIVLVREGFAFWAFAFHFLWLLSQRLWVTALLFLGVMVALEHYGTQVGLSNITVAVLQFALQLLLGFAARDLQRFKLVRAGYREIGIVCAESELLAERRYFDRVAAA